MYGNVASTAGSHTHPRKKRPLNLPVPEVIVIQQYTEVLLTYFCIIQVYNVITEDGLTLRLTRYAQPEGMKPKGPLLAVHGMGVSSRIFLMDTIHVSLGEYLHKQGYDIH